MEKTSLNRRVKIRITLYISAVFLVLSIFSIVQTVKSNKLERQLMSYNQSSLISLDENLNNISTNLEKVIYSNTSEMLSKLATELWREASGAKVNLSMLPISDIQLYNTYKFLSQIGEFVMYIGRKTAKGEELKLEEKKQLEELYNYCKELNDQVSNMCYELENGTLSFEDYNLNLLDGADAITLSEVLDNAEQSLTDLPSLIYDGPFSDHIEQGEPKFLTDKENINQEKAFEIAKSICNSNEASSLDYAYDDNGSIPCFVFKSKNSTIAITKTGGVPLYMISSRFAGEINLSNEAAVRNASDFLNKIGYKNMIETYYFTEDGICTVNFAFKETENIIYPDLIKVSVSLETGDVLSFEATGFVFNHYSRNIEQPRLSLESAKSIISPNLEVINHRLCIIPTDWKDEQYCYEFHCKAESGQEILVYIDCKTGAEDNILILLYSDGGVLTK